MPASQVNSELLDALRDAHRVLKVASRQLTEDHKMVLMGRGWGWRTIATIEGVIAKAEQQKQSDPLPANS